MKKKPTRKTHRKTKRKPGDSLQIIAPYSLCKKCAANARHLSQIEHLQVKLPAADGSRFIWLRDICYCEGAGSYTDVHLVDNTTVVVSMNLKNFETLLSPYFFRRTHHSFLVNMLLIEGETKGDSPKLRLKGGSMVSISRRKKENLEPPYLT